MEGPRVFKTPIWVTGPHWSDSAQLDNLLQHPMIVNVSSTQIPSHGLGWPEEQVFRHFSQECRAEVLDPRRRSSVYKSADLTTRPCSHTYLLVNFLKRTKGWLDKISPKSWLAIIEKYYNFQDTKLLGVDGTPSTLVGIYLGEGSLWYKNQGRWGS